MVGVSGCDTKRRLDLADNPTGADIIANDIASQSENVHPAMAAFEVTSPRISPVFDTPSRPLRLISSNKGTEARSS
ncbi:hypothetical protein [Rhodococcus sp. DMU1]|uniref:hypothetical protein n=1 Tax=Rhodococcus sp. DMU1 TaxID=2722825 RepID=UPI001B2FEE41|nr:hypothetical protein [Rhodococcus sp. DMU1]